MELQREVERYLEQTDLVTVDEVSGLGDAMRYSLLAGGKRIRPVLALATAQATGVDIEFAMPTAAAIELIHTYSLIHDDLPAMDDDDLRRGRATCHVAYGENVAILAGDGLFAEAFRHVLERQEGPPERVLAVLHEIAAATGAGGMVGGQYLDVTDRAPAGAEGLRLLHELKTGRLIACAVRSVLLLSEADSAIKAPLERFAAEVGVLFQIVDDILDVTGSQEVLGKSPGTDERLGKRTYVSVYGLDRARELAGESHRATREALECAAESPDADVDTLMRIADFVYTRTS